MTMVADTTHMKYEGKAKRVYATGDPERYLVEYKDDATAFNGEKRGTITGKGELNSEISATFMELLATRGIPTHFVERAGATAQLVRAVEIIPLEVVVRNIAAGSLAQRLGIAEGTALAHPIVEFYYKRDDLGDPMLTRAHVSLLGLADGRTLDRLEDLGFQINDVLTGHLAARGVTLVDCKLEFGRTGDGELILADEISPDTCRFWDSGTGEKLDKDRFRRDLGGVEQAYTELLRRLTGEVAR